MLIALFDPFSLYNQPLNEVSAWTKQFLPIIFLCNNISWHTFSHENNTLDIGYTYTKIDVNHRVQVYVYQNAYLYDII